MTGQANDRVPPSTLTFVAVALFAVVSVLVFATASSRRLPDEAASSSTTSSEAVTGTYDRRGDDLASILLPTTSETRTAELCERWISLLQPEHRNRCAEVHLVVAKQAIDGNDFDRARRALAFSETEGGSLSEIRKLRRKLPANPTLSRVSPAHQPEQINASSSRERNLNAVVQQLDPLFERWEFIGPVSVRMQLNAAAWNSMAHDQQQQLMDTLASKAVIQETRCTLHIYAYQTKVGTIGPGWTGEWKFRRNG